MDRVSVYGLKDNDTEGWTEHMNLHEYQAKQLFAAMAYQHRWVMPVLLRAKQKSRFKNRCRSVGSEMSGSRWCRGKAGGVKVVNSKEDIRAFEKTGWASVW